MSSIAIAHAQSGSGICGRVPRPVRQYCSAASVGDVGRLLAVVAAMGDEVLEDDLLQMPVLRVDLGERGQRVEAVLAGLADADEDAARERDAQLARRADRASRSCGSLVGEPVGDQVRAQRLEHQPLRRRHLAQPREILARQRTEVRVRQHPRSSARSHAHAT